MSCSAPPRLIWGVGLIGVCISAAMAYKARKKEKEAMWSREQQEKDKVWL